MRRSTGSPTSVDPDGTIVAPTPSDYAGPCASSSSPCSATSAGVALPPWASETWEALPAEEGDRPGITYAQLGKRLGIGRDAARDRAAWLLTRGAAVNLAAKGKHARLVRGDAPGSERLLAPVEELELDG
jgi:hypothetical protein